MISIYAGILNAIVLNRCMDITASPVDYLIGIMFSTFLSTDIRMQNVNLNSHELTMVQSFFGLFLYYGP